MALPPNTYRDMFYEPLLTPGLFDAILTGGGPAYVDIAPGAMPEPVEFTTPAPPPVDEFQQRIAQAEEQARALAQAPLAPSVQPSAPPIMAAPAPTNAEGAPLFDPEFMAKMASLGQALGPNPLFIGTNFGGMPTEQSLNLLRDPATGLMVNKSRTVELDDTGRVVREITPEGSVPGVYFTDNRGMPATKGLGKGARFTPLDPNAVYTVVNQRTGEVVSTGVGAEGMKAAQLASMQLSSAGGRKADWAVVKTDPSTGTDSTVANVDPRQSDLGKLADVALPLAGAFLVPGLGLVGSKVLGAGLGAAAGSGLSSAAQGRPLGESLLRAGLSGAGAAGGAALGEAVGTAVGKAASQKLAQTGAEAATQKLAQTGAEAVGNIIVPGFKSALTGATVGGVLGGGASGALSSMLPGKGADFADRVFQQPTTSEGNPIVVSGSRIPTSNIGADMIGGAFNTALPAVTTITNPASPPSDNEIVVTKPASAQVMEGTLGAGLAAGVPAVTSVATSPAAPEKNSLLDEIIKYYGLASTGLDLLGSAFGGGGAGRMTPYASQLGPMPTFTRGPFTPFGGDYETYGFGPEFNFFGGAPAPTPTAPGMGILPPRANPGFGIV